MNVKKDRTGEFLALLFRQKDINRWGLMRNLYPEKLSEHSFEVSVIAHSLALIGNLKFSKNYDASKIATAALYHDMSEILTGDLPTPVKYYNNEIKTAYKKIEKNAEKIMLSLLDDEIRGAYTDLFSLSPEEKRIIKTADKLCAYIKCLDELSGGNKEFVSAEKTIKDQLDTLDLEEGRFFIEHYLDAFTKPLDDIALKGEAE